MLRLPLSGISSGRVLYANRDHIVGAVIRAVALHDASDEVLEIVLSFGLAALLFLVTEELLVDAHEEPETPLSTEIFFAGFLVILILGMME